MANDMVEIRRPGEDLTGQATAAVTGKRFLRISAARTNKFNVLGTDASGNNHKVAHSAAGGHSVGVSKYDQPNIGGKVGIRSAGIVTVTAGAALTAGQYVMSDANGQAIPWVTAVSEANQKLGVATDDCLLGADAEVMLLIA